jgi:hypothetical protein
MLVKTLMMALEKLPHLVAIPKRIETGGPPTKI